MLHINAMEHHMQFTFWATVNNTEVQLKTTNLFGARREAKQLGATACWGMNPSTRKTFDVATH